MAALAAKRRKAEEAGPKNAPTVFVVRHPDGRFGWEIRRYGAFVLEQGSETFDNLPLARSAGELAMSRSPDARR